METVDTLREELLAAVNAADTFDALDDARVKALDKKGRITAEM